VATTARKASGVLDGIPALLEAEREIIASERRAVLAGIDSQRLQTLGVLKEYVSGERLALVAAVRDERVATVAAVHQERLETIAAVDSMRKVTVDSSLVGLRELVDYTIWRVAMLVAALMLLAAVLGIVAVRLTSGHGHGRGEWSRVGTTAAHP
jgi:hypothetical protein